MQQAINNIDFSQVENYLNRHLDPLPQEECKITILHPEEGLLECKWKPREIVEIRDDSDFATVRQMHPDIIGSAETLKGKNKGICYLVWQNNNSDFVHYYVNEF